MRPEDAIGGLLVALAVGVVLGIAALLLIYKMVDGHVPVPAGLCALVMIVLAEALSIHPSHPAMPGIVLVLAITLMALFPYAEEKLEEFALRGIYAGQLAKSFESVRVRPDNFAAKFSLAEMLYSHGFHGQAIHLLSTTLAGLSVERDKVKNDSLRDVFHREDALLRRWQSQPQGPASIKCPTCSAPNRPEDVLCRSCGRPYMLDIVQRQEVAPRVWAKLVLTWAALCLFVPGIVTIGMDLDGFIRVIAFLGAFAAIAGLIGWLFKPPKYAPPIYS